MRINGLHKSLAKFEQTIVRIYICVCVCVASCARFAPVNSDLRALPRENPRAQTKRRFCKRTLATTMGAPKIVNLAKWRQHSENITLSNRDCNTAIIFFCLHYHPKPVCRIYLAIYPLTRRPPAADEWWHHVEHIYPLQISCLPEK